jgi:hypothetical protein
MSDFMMSQVQGLLGKVADDIDKMSKTTSVQGEMVLEAINDLAANLFATQAILCVLLRDHPVDPAKVKEWITKQTDAGGTPAPKTHAIVDMLLGFDKKTIISQPPTRGA